MGGGGGGGGGDGCGYGADPFPIQSIYMHEQKHCFIKQWDHDLAI